MSIPEFFWNNNTLSRQERAEDSGTFSLVHWSVSGSLRDSSRFKHFSQTA